MVSMETNVSKHKILQSVSIAQGNGTQSFLMLVMEQHALTSLAGKEGWQVSLNLQQESPQPR